MRGREETDRMVMVALALGVAGLVLSSMVGRFLDAVSGAVRSPLLPLAAGAIVVLTFVVVVARLRLTRAVLRRRVRVALVPADTFSPDPEAVARFAATLSRSGGVEVARAELVLARSSAAALREVAIDPDPLSAFAQALATLRPEDESAAVCIDLLPVGPGRRRRERRRILRSAANAQRGRQAVAEMSGDLFGGSRRRSELVAAERVERRIAHETISNKLGSSDPLFVVQVLVRVSSPVRGRAVVQLGRLIAGFDQFAGENHFRVRGVRMAGGGAFLGADAPWRRGRFDRRVRTGLFAPGRRRIVTATEVAGLLKPPTAHCDSENVVRSGGAIPPAARSLPSFAHQRELIPLGTVRDGDGGERMVGVPVEGTFFSYMAGRSRYGKTETGIGQFLHFARTGRGCFFLDPHEDAIERIQRYLREEERARLVVVNFADHVAERQIGWNLFAGESGTAGQRLDAVVDAFSSALRWNEVNARALNLTTQSAKALITPTPSNSRRTT